MLSGTHFDPRPDIQHDHHLWDKVLILAQEEPYIQSCLHYLRCHGCWLVETPNMYRIAPGLIPGVVWDDAKAQGLEPIKDKLVACFSKWRQVTGVKEEVYQIALVGDMTLAEAEEIFKRFIKGPPEQQEFFMEALNGQKGNSDTGHRNLWHR